MRDFEGKLKLYKENEQSNCKFYDNHICSRPEGCVCKTIARMWAYMDAVLPHGYMNLDLNDFVGKVDNDRVIDPKDVIRIKSQISAFCWGKKMLSLPVAKQSMLTATDRDKMSVMDDRFKSGSNLIIHGESSFIQGESEFQRRKKVKKGKTLLASVVMQQAIRRLIYDTTPYSSFNWVAYPELVGNLLQGARRPEVMLGLETLAETHWLVIDNIEPPSPRSEAQEQFLIDQLNLFFSDRVENGFPTIFVFQFDIDNYDIKRYYGYSMASAVESGNSLKIKV